MIGVDSTSWYILRVQRMVPVWKDPTSDSPQKITEADRGTLRYLGVWLMLTILDGDVTKEDWEAQEIVLEGIIDRFYKSCSRLGLSTEVYREVVTCNAHYVSKVTYILRVARPSEAMVSLCRTRAAQGMLKTLGIATNPKQRTPSVRENVAHLPVEYGGCGIRDVRAVLLYQQLKDVMAAMSCDTEGIEHEAWMYPIRQILATKNGSSFPSVRRMFREFKRYSFDPRCTEFQ